MVDAYATGSLTAIERRRSVLQALANGDLPVAAATDRFVATTKTFNTNLNRNTQFTEELNRLSARDHFTALQQVVESKQKAG
jgi:hypothetical protein